MAVDVRKTVLVVRHQDLAGDSTGIHPPGSDVAIVETSGNHRLSTSLKTASAVGIDQWLVSAGQFADGGQSNTTERKARSIVNGSINRASVSPVSVAAVGSGDGKSNR